MEELWDLVPDAWKLASVYAGTAIWCVFAMLAYVDCWREWVADRKELRATDRHGLILLALVARSRLRRATYFVKMAHMKAIAGLLALIYIFVVPPSTESSPYQLVLRILFILDIYWFWSAKRVDRGLRDTVRARRESLDTDDKGKGNDEAPGEAKEDR